MSKDALKGLSESQLQELAMKGLKAKATQQRQWIKDRLLIKKAIAAGFTVTDAEIANYLKNEYKK